MSALTKFNNNDDVNLFVNIYYAIIRCFT